jgi:hypothetical protein
VTGLLIQHLHRERERLQIEAAAYRTLLATVAEDLDATAQRFAHLGHPHDAARERRRAERVRLALGRIGRTILRGRASGETHFLDAASRVR